MIPDVQAELPPIAMTRAEAEKLARIADAAGGPLQQAAEVLAREVARAELIDEADAPAGLVRIHSRVAFRDDVTGQERTVTLVYPDEADVTEGRISVLTPVGAALIGLSVGQSIAWQSPSGGWRSLTVLKAE
jgi:regulator of nucleoside diphosphate kinase